MGIVGNIGWVDRLEKKIDGFDARVKEGNVALIKMRKSPKDAMAAYADAAECFRKLRRREGGYGARPDALHILKRMDAAGYPPSFKPEPDLPEFGELLRAGCSLNLAPLGKENPEEIHLLNAMKANAESLELVGSLVPAQSQYLAARKRMAL